MFKYTRHTLGKLEELFKELDYTVRYEKGNFQSGYCIVENRKVVIVNKFFETEGRINTLVEIVSGLDLEAASLSEKSAKFLKAVKNRSEEEVD